MPSDCRCSACDCACACECGTHDSSCACTYSKIKSETLKKLEEEITDLELKNERLRKIPEVKKEELIDSIEKKIK